MPSTVWPASNWDPYLETVPAPGARIVHAISHLPDQVKSQSTDRPILDRATDIGIGNSHRIERPAVVLDLYYRMSGLKSNANTNVMDRAIIVGIVDDIRD